ncbi:hypothetical protein MMC14_008086 [Varicellaria rhodocarpa]|nr:hypothetical protein [Varicellaria rhodocarpa]
MAGGSGDWLLQSSGFIEWLGRFGATLVCTGIPGAGKTILASVVIDHPWTNCLNEDTGVACIYCNYKAQFEQTPLDLIANLLKQLLQELGTTPKELHTLYRRHIKKRTKAALEEIVHVLHVVLSRFSRVFMVIDALDECSDLSILLDQVRELQSLHAVNLVVTSRHVPNIMDRFPNAIHLEICASEADIQTYVASQIPRLASCVTGNQTLQEHITSGIVEAVDGMYGIMASRNGSLC